jgi:hypothetical protein
MEVWGLVLNIVGVLILAFAQNCLDATVRVWLMALDWSVESVIDRSTPSEVYVKSMGRQMEGTLKTNKWLSSVGWAITATGFILQLIAILQHR